MRNLLIITQKVDKNDDHRGFFIDWLGEFAKKFDKVSVITLAAGSYELPENVKVYSLGKEHGTPKFIQALRFYWHLVRLVPVCDGIFAHASPVFVIASWPLAFIYRKKIVLWYLHRSVTMRLKLAERLSYRIVTAAKESLKLKSNKIIETGHGIDVDKFKTQRNWEAGGKLRILSVGRISKIKNYDTLLEAAKILKDRGLDFNIKIVGQPVMPPDIHYFDSLKFMQKKLDLVGAVNFEGYVPHNKVGNYYRDGDIVVGLTPDGGIDKTILEGMASGCLVLTSNNACRKYFGDYSGKLIFNYRDPRNLADKIMSLGRLSLEDKKNISNFLVDSVSRHHRLVNVINSISSLL